MAKFGLSLAIIASFFILHAVALETRELDFFHVYYGCAKLPGQTTHYKTATTLSRDIVVMQDTPSQYLAPCSALDFEHNPIGDTADPMNLC
jgi:hypothetical protein